MRSTGYLIVTSNTNEPQHVREIVATVANPATSGYIYAAAIPALIATIAAMAVSFRNSGQTPQGKPAYD